MISMSSHVLSLSPETQRKVGSFIGAIVADAASLHLEWIYDQNKVNKIVSKEKDPAFWEEDHCPFFSLPNGKVSCYADQAIQALDIMYKNGGSLDESKLIDHFLQYFGDPGSPYQVSLAKRRNNNYPVEGPWLHGAIIAMIDRFKAGIYPPGDEDAREYDALVTALPLIIKQSSTEDHLDLERVFHVLTQDPFAVQHHQAEAFLISQHIQETEDPFQAMKEKFKQNEDIFNEIVAVEKGKAAGEEAKYLVKRFGMACPMPGSFQSSLVSIIGATSYADAIRETILCGGDSCTRGILIGACLGAKFGIQSIPVTWLNKVDGIEDIINKAIECFS